MKRIQDWNVLGVAGLNGPLHQCVTVAQLLYLYELQKEGCPNIAEETVKKARVGRTSTVRIGISFHLNNYDYMQDCNCIYFYARVCA